VPTPETRASSVAFTYKDQKNAGLVTATYTNSDSQIASTEFVSSTTSSSSSNASQPSSPPAPPSPPNRNNIGAIIGSAIGGFIALSLVFLAIFWFVRRSKENGTSSAERLRSPSQVSPMEQTQLTGTPSFNLIVGKPGPNSSVQSGWRSSMMTSPSSAGNSASPQGWMNQPGSPGAQSTTSQGIPQFIPQAVPYEMSGDSVQTEAHGIHGDPRRSRVYEMVGDAPHSWI
jgi:predicted lipid-binding transport protein (Tim44 family)